LQCNICPIKLNINNIKEFMPNIFMTITLKGALLRTIFQKKSTKGHDCYLGPVKSDLDSD
jgi:hypothetical protein